MRPGESIESSESCWLAPVAVTMLESLYQHRLLSTVQLHELHTPTDVPAMDAERSLCRACIRASSRLRPPRGATDSGCGT